MSDPYHLQRFVDAQRPVYAHVLEELRAGRKTSHWMWFVFPQIEGLGSSPMARTFAISSLAEARAYLDHALLGARLNECTQLVLQVKGRTVREIFGPPDDLKFRSSMTLFAQATEPDSLFASALHAHFNGEPDALTLERLGAEARQPPA